MVNINTKSPKKEKKNCIFTPCTLIYYASKRKIHLLTNLLPQTQIFEIITITTIETLAHVVSQYYYYPCALGDKIVILMISNILFIRVDWLRGGIFGQRNPMLLSESEFHPTEFYFPKLLCRLLEHTLFLTQLQEMQFTLSHIHSCITHCFQVKNCTPTH